MGMNTLQRKPVKKASITTGKALSDANLKRGDLVFLHVVGVDPKAESRFVGITNGGIVFTINDVRHFVTWERILEGTFCKA
jgi:hypothetical protein